MKRFMLIGMFLLLPWSAHSVEYQWQNAAGEEVNLASLKGKPVVLHFWASWCPPCRSEMPHLVEWVKQNPEKKVVMVSLDSDIADAQEFFEKRGITLPLFIGKMGDTSRLGVRGLPSTFIIDENSNVKKRYRGNLDWSDSKVSAEVLQLL